MGLLAASFFFDISTEIFDPVFPGSFGFLRPGYFRRVPGGMIQDDDDHLGVFRILRFSPAAGRNLLPDFGVELQNQIYELGEGSSRRFLAGRSHLFYPLSRP